MEYVRVIKIGGAGNRVKIHILRHDEPSRPSNYGLITKLAVKSLRSRLIHARYTGGKMPWFLIDQKKLRRYERVWKRIYKKRPLGYEVSHVLTTPNGGHFGIVFSKIKGKGDA